MVKARVPCEPASHLKGPSVSAACPNQGLFKCNLAEINKKEISDNLAGLAAFPGSAVSCQQLL